MIEAHQILKKEIGLFVENNIDAYRGTPDIIFREMLDMFFNNDGFFVLQEENNKISYLDVSDVEKIKRLISQDHQIYEKKLKDIDLNIFNNYCIKSVESVESVLQQLKTSNQTYFPIINLYNKLIGRVSIKFLKNRIDNIYGDLGIKFY